MWIAPVGLMAIVGSSCGETSFDSGAKVKFVGNATCPTGGKDQSGNPIGPYSPKPPFVNSLPAVGQAIDEMPHTHIQPPATVQYNHNPPTSGCHYFIPAQGSIPAQAPIPHGVYNSAIPSEYWVHNLEHGYVAVLYNCPSGCTGDFATLRQWAQGLPNDPGGAVSYAKIIVLPYSGMDHKFAMVSWDWYDWMDTLDMNHVQRFYDNHINQSPESASAP